MAHASYVSPFTRDTRDVARMRRNAVADLRYQYEGPITAAVRGWRDAQPGALKELVNLIAEAKSACEGVLTASGKEGCVSAVAVPRSANHVIVRAGDAILAAFDLEYGEDLPGPDVIDIAGRRNLLDPRKKLLMTALEVNDVPSWDRALLAVSEILACYSIRGGQVRGRVTEPGYANRADDLHDVNYRHCAQAYPERGPWPTSNVDPRIQLTIRSR